MNIDTLTIRPDQSQATTAGSGIQNTSDISSGSLTYGVRPQPAPIQLQIRNLMVLSPAIESPVEPNVIVQLSRRALDVLNTPSAGEHDFPEEL
jgi:hypothetical protein